MTPLKQQISLIPFSIELWYSPYKRRRFKNRSRGGWLLLVIWICAWIPVFFNFLPHWAIGDFPTFVSISRFSQFSYNQQPMSTKLGEMNDAEECIHNFGTDPQFWNGYLTDIQIQINPNSNPDHFCFKFWHRQRFALSITDRTFLISKIQNVWSDRFSKCRPL